MLLTLAAAHPALTDPARIALLEHAGHGSDPGTMAVLTALLTHPVHGPATIADVADRHAITVAPVTDPRGRTHALAALAAVLPDGVWDHAHRTSQLPLTDLTTITTCPAVRWKAYPPVRVWAAALSDPTVPGPLRAAAADHLARVTTLAPHHLDALGAYLRTRPGVADAVRAHASAAAVPVLDCVRALRPPQEDPITVREDLVANPRAVRGILIRAGAAGDAGAHAAVEDRTATADLISRLAVCAMVPMAVRVRAAHLLLEDLTVDDEDDFGATYDGLAPLIGDPALPTADLLALQDHEVASWTDIHAVLDRADLTSADLDRALHAVALHPVPDPGIALVSIAAHAHASTAQQRAATDAALDAGAPPALVRALTALPDRSRAGAGLPTVLPEDTSAPVADLARAGLGELLPALTDATRAHTFVRLAEHFTGTIAELFDTAVSVNA